MKEKGLNPAEGIAKAIFVLCGVTAIFAVCSITIYMIVKGTPALTKVGVLSLLFGREWKLRLLKKA